MTRPFGGVLPAVIPYSGNCDSKGNATINIRPRAAFWWAGKAVTKVSAGSPVVDVTMGGIFGGFGRGQRSEVAGLLVAPGDTVTISVIGAQANATVSGALQGKQGPTMADVGDSHSPAPNTIALDTAQGHVLLGTITTPGDSAPHSLTFPVATGSIQAVGLVTVVPAFAAPATATIKGDVTGNTYVSWPVTGGYGADVERWFLPDVNAICTVTDAGSPSRVNFLAFNFGPVTTVRAGLFPLDVTQQHASPALWQAPNAIPAQFNQTFAHGAAATVIVPAVAGKSIFLFALNITCDTTDAVGLLQLQDTNGTGYHVFTNNTATAQVAQFAGAPLPFPLGAQLANIGTADMIARGSLVYSQG